jgi:IrrE N-terminal-like domain
VGEDQAGTYARLCGVAKSLGYSVEDAILPGETNGDCTPNIRRIRVEQANSPSQRVKTLAHELAHAILHEDSEESRELKELEAESVAYVVCANLGLDTGGYSFGYVAVWAGGGSEALAAIKSSGARIQRAGDVILAKLEG